MFGEYHTIVIDGNIFNKHNDQGKKDISKKDLFYLHGIYSIQNSLTVLISSCNFEVEKNSVFMYAMNIQNDVIIGLILRQNCRSKQVTDFIA